jgi:PTS system galactitol-specific IIB component
MPSKSLLVICGTGVATSTVVAKIIAEHCAANGIDVDVRQGKVMDLLGDTPDVDVIVATTQVPESVTVPVVAGLAFLTGIGKDAALDEIVRLLSS